MNLNQYRHIGGLFPTLFDMPELWRLNSTRMGGRFNFVFCWLYIVLLPPMLFFTFLCIVEYYLTPVGCRSEMKLESRENDDT